ncbi:uncharacterized protein TNCV_2096271 [Trichonephila clavipes]|nr:uncharacterized protein TNCV_2096271 [Trichonephila clavipes]
MNTDPGKLIGTKLFLHKSRFSLGGHDGRIHVRRYVGERCLPECVFEQHIDLTPGVTASSVISYHGRSILLRIEGNLNSNGYVREVLQPKVASNPSRYFWSCYSAG